MGYRSASVAGGHGPAVVQGVGGLARVASGGIGIIHYERSCDSDGHAQGIGSEDGVLSAKRRIDRVDRQAGTGQSVSSCWRLGEPYAELVC